jgi:hypothetical protein
MKSIASQVLNYRNFSKLILCALLLFAAGCKDKNEPTSDPQSIVGDLPVPAWTPAMEYDMTSSMTLIVKVDLSITYPEQVASIGWNTSPNDLLAAFDGTNCIGIANCQDGLFFLYVTAPKDGNQLTLTYYSAQLKNLFDAEQTISFHNDAIIGSVAAPFTPKFTKY